MSIEDAGETVNSIIGLVNTTSGSVLFHAPETIDWAYQRLVDDYYANARPGYYLVVCQFQVYPNTTPARDFVMVRLDGETGASGTTIPLTQYCSTMMTYTTFIWRQPSASPHLSMNIFCPTPGMELAINYKITAIRIRE
jgi:hypothetical protein